MLDCERYVGMVRRGDIDEVGNFFRKVRGMCDVNPVAVSGELPTILRLSMVEYDRFNRGEIPHSDKIKVYYIKFLILLRNFLRAVHGIEKISNENDLGPELTARFIQDSRYDLKTLEFFTTFNQVPLEKLLESIVYNQIKELRFFYNRLVELYNIDYKNVEYFMNIQTNKCKFLESNRDFLESHLINLAEPAEIPPWVSISEEEKHIGRKILNKELYEISTLEPTEEDLEELKVGFYEGITETIEGFNIDDFFDWYKETVIEEVRTYKLEDKYINPVRVFGPANPIQGRGCKYDNKACRMLTCTCYGENWFKGICNSYGPEILKDGSLSNNFYCHKKISNISHCLRRPLPNGAFTGCFCSEECIRKKYIDKLSNTQNNDDEEPESRYELDDDEQDDTTNSIEIYKLQLTLTTIFNQGILDQSQL